MDLKERIFNVTPSSFEDLALEVFQYQIENNQLYANFCAQLKLSSPKCLTEIPFLPISFFKSHDVLVKGKTSETKFLSSGTGGERSRHLVADVFMYEKSFLTYFTSCYGEPYEYIILALLPNYLEQGESSLVYMVNHLIDKSQSPLSGFFLDDYEGILTNIESARITGKKIILFGVSYALLDFAALNPNLSDLIIIETGGMKGRRKEITKAELHTELKQSFGVKSIHSEYGMTELLSQAYSLGDAVFQTPNWMKISIRDTNDPLELLANGKTGGVNIIDLANLYSCPFIATQDLGRVVPNGFEIVGRFDLADIRGCNLLVQ
jgi:hypothetical protein